MLLDGRRVARFDELADLVVQHGPRRERQRLVRHLLGQDVLEQVRQLGLG